MNPFEQKPLPIEKALSNWENLYPMSYNKFCTDPYTKARIVLMNGTEFEAVWFLHQFNRHCSNNELRRELAFIRRIEQQQQKKIQDLKPINENILETTITYEQLAVDLTAKLAQMEQDMNVRNALNFALLEDFDHLYRYSDLLEMEYKILPEKLVGGYTEIMPARPTISHHRHPYDSINNFVNFKTASDQTKLNISIITAAEQQTMNFYMNIGQYYTSDIGRKLYQEIAMVEEQHVSEYGSLSDPNSTWLERLLLHEYTECYLYYSCLKTETDPYIKKIWECFLQYEITHLHIACNLLKKYENKEWQQVISCGEFPEILRLCPNIEYVRNVIRNTASMTKVREDYANVCDLSCDFDFFKYQNIVNCSEQIVPSHIVIDKYIQKCSIDYRYEVAPNPICELQNRKCDNFCVGREPLCNCDEK